MAKVSYGGAKTYPANGETGLSGRKHNSEGIIVRGALDTPFLILTLVILAIGVVMVLSASFARAYYTEGEPTKYFIRQLGYALGGVAAMLVISRISIAKWKKYSLHILVISVFLLVAVMIIGVAAGGAKRWISLGFTTFQPSEIAKLAVVLSFAKLICIYRGKMGTFKYGVLPFGIILGVICILLALEPHYSAAIIIIGIGAIMMWMGGTRLFWFLLGLAVVALAAFVVFQRGDHASSRIIAWRHPFDDLNGKGWQIVQSLYAIGSGGLLGLGIGQGRQKYMYLPEEHNDYIFSVVCEELGFIGAMLILVLFALLIIRGYWIALHARDRYGTLVAAGLTSLLAIQVFLNVAVVTNFLPSTGISLPFFSYGGTALMLQLGEMGIILAVSRDIPLKEKKEKKEKEKRSDEK